MWPTVCSSSCEYSKRVFSHFPCKWGVCSLALSLVVLCTLATYQTVASVTSWVGCVRTITRKAPVRTATCTLDSTGTHALSSPLHYPSAPRVLLVHYRRYCALLSMSAAATEEERGLKRRRTEGLAYAPGQVDFAVETVPQSRTLVVWDSRRCPSGGPWMSWMSGPSFRGVFDKASRVLLYRVSFSFDEWLLPYQATQVYVTQVGGAGAGAYSFNLTRSSCTSAGTLCTEFNAKADAALGAGELILATYTVGSFTYFTLQNTVVGSTMTVYGGFIRYGQVAHGLGSGSDPSVSVEVAQGTLYLGGRAMLVPSRSYYLTSSQLSQLTQAGSSGHTESTALCVISRSDIAAGISIDDKMTAKMIPGRSLSVIDFQLRDEFNFIVRNGAVNADTGSYLPQPQGWLQVEMVVYQGPF